MNNKCLFLRIRVLHDIDSLCLNKNDETVVKISRCNNYLIMIQHAYHKTSWTYNSVLEYIDILNIVV